LGNQIGPRAHGTMSWGKPVKVHAFNFFQGIDPARPIVVTKPLISDPSLREDINDLDRSFIGEIHHDNTVGMAGTDVA
jgi:hypothetical protein